MRVRLRDRCPCSCSLVAACVAAGTAADMAKTLRVAFPDRGKRLRPAGRLRHLLVRRLPRDLRPALHVRLFRAAGAACPEHRRGPAGRDRRRADLHDQGEARHLLRRRPGLQGQAARAHRRRLRLFDQADHRSQGALVLALPAREEPGRPRSTCSPRRAKRARSTTTRRSKACRRSTATRCASVSIGRTTRSSGGSRPVQFAAVAREVVDAYKDASNRVMDNPVGTGPYVLKQWTRGQHIVLEANPAFRDVLYPAPGAGQRAGRCRDRQRTRRQAPAARRPRRHQHHRGVAAAPAELRHGRARLLRRAGVARRPTFSHGAELKPELAKRGIVLHREVSPSISFFFFNLDDPLVGGYTPEKLALRRAISMGFDRERADPPGTAWTGDPRHAAGAAGTLWPRSEIRRALRLRSRRRAGAPGQVRLQGPRRRRLSRAARRQAVDDRRLPRRPTRLHALDDELWKRSLDAIGVRVTFLKNKWTELNKMSEAGQLMMWGLGWISQHSGRPRLLQLLLQPQHRHVERCADAASGVGRAVPAVARASRRPRADGAVRPDERSRSSTTRRGS